MYKFLPPRVAVTPPGMAREDWKIIRALSEVHSMELYIHILYTLQSLILSMWILLHIQ